VEFDRVAGKRDRSVRVTETAAQAAVTWLSKGRDRIDQIVLEAMGAAGAA